MLIFLKNISRRFFSIQKLRPEFRQGHKESGNDAQEEAKTRAPLKTAAAQAQQPPSPARKPAGGGLRFAVSGSPQN